eukprot:CAMPEP_0202023462 /NCGR_PEP_ID=MMETSP0905-20130828/51942_1 /ASSEMBLY_ACC=CAM_ASM_000554 /TAXON_ID=420261 /ORGANISM="Thalassiosira antarctica, Strain CCMP982" /LENGTH=646 /DNA_ID=CAMNT_0048585845 /DNA_START=130 /DNA_END=2067 /DNA_ORIENTATION=-
MPPPDAHADADADASRKVCWNHPLHDYDLTSSITDNKSMLTPEQLSQQQQQRTPPRAERHSSHSPLREDDWYQYTLHNTPATPTTTPSASPAKLPSNYTQGPQRYESLTGLLLQSGASPSFGVLDDDESYKHMSIVDDGSMFDLDDSGSGRRRNRGRCRFLGCTWYCFRYDSPCAILLGLVMIGTLGVFLGLILPSSSEDPSTTLSDDTNTKQWDMTSNILGYTYFLSWTLSFYPQIITNWHHPSKARMGVSLDFIVWNIVGFACYAIYTTTFRYSHVVRREYAERFGGGDDDDEAGGGTGGTNVTGTLVHILLSMEKHHHHIPNPFNWTNSSTADDSNSNGENEGSNNATNSDDSWSNTTNSDDSSSNDAMAVPQVKMNDVAFAWHALLLTIITFVQIVWWSERSNRRDNDTVGDFVDDEWIEVQGGEDTVTVEDLGRENSTLSKRTVGEECDFVGSHLNNDNEDTLSEQGIENVEFLAQDDHPLLEQQQCHLRHNNLQQQQTQDPNHSPHDTPTQSVPPLVHHPDQHWMQRISSTTKCLLPLLLLVCIAGAIMVACNVNIGYWGGKKDRWWQWIDYLYFLSFVKVGVSIVKYIPQVVLNYQRKSTSGWQIWNILLDFSGGTLSIVQLVGDSFAEAKAQGLPHSW